MRRLLTTLTVTVTALAASAATAVGPAAGPAAAASCTGYVALTFDDGPNSGNTTTLLNTLRSAGARATLFNIGQNAAANPSLVQAERAAGMWVQNHSYTHPHMTSLSQSQMSSELSRTQSAIQNAGGGTPTLVRPPYGETNATLQAAASALGLRTVTWDVDSQDWNGASTSAIVQAASRLQNGQIMLMHDQYATTIAPSRRSSAACREGPGPRHDPCLPRPGRGPGRHHGDDRHHDDDPQHVATAHDHPHHHNVGWGRSGDLHGVLHGGQPVAGRVRRQRQRLRRWLGHQRLAGHPGPPGWSLDRLAVETASGNSNTVTVTNQSYNSRLGKPNASFGFRAPAPEPERACTAT